MLVYKQACNKNFNVEIYDDKIIVYIKDIPTDNYNKSKLCFEIVDIYVFDKIHIEIRYKENVYNINNKEDIIKFLKNCDIKIFYYFFYINTIR